MAAALAVDGIIHPYAYALTAHKPGLTQDLHMVRQRGLTDPQSLQQAAGTLLTLAQLLKDLYTVLVGQCPEHSEILVHDIMPPRSLC